MWNSKKVENTSFHTEDVIFDLITVNSDSTYSILVTHFRIIGLDPAGPLEGPIANAILGGHHLTAADADTVLIIHTDKMVYGYALSTGSADINMNGGIRYQPGCPFAVPFTSFINKAGMHMLFLIIFFPFFT